MFAQSAATISSSPCRDLFPGTAGSLHLLQPDAVVYAATKKRSQLTPTVQRIAEPQQSTAVDRVPFECSFQPLQSYLHCP